MWRTGSANASYPHPRACASRYTRLRRSHQEVFATEVLEPWLRRKAALTRPATRFFQFIQNNEDDASDGSGRIGAPAPRGDAWWPGLVIQLQPSFDLSSAGQPVGRSTEQCVLPDLLGDIVPAELTGLVPGGSVGTGRPAPGADVRWHGLIIQLQPSSSLDLSSAGQSIGLPPWQPPGKSGGSVGTGRPAPGADVQWRGLIVQLQPSSSLDLSSAGQSTGLQPWQPLRRSHGVSVLLLGDVVPGRVPRGSVGTERSALRSVWHATNKGSVSNITKQLIFI